MLVEARGLRDYKRICIWVSHLKKNIPIYILNISRFHRNVGNLYYAKYLEFQELPDIRF